MRQLRISTDKSSPSISSIKFLSAIGMIVLVMIVLTVWLFNRLTTYGEKINELQRAKKFLETENQLLENNIALKSSLQRLEEKARQSGFTEINKIEYITDSN